MDPMSEVRNLIDSYQASIKKEQSSEVTKQANGLASSSKVETNTTLLADIRDQVCKTNEILLRLESLHLERERADEKRHADVCTVLLALTRNHPIQPAETKPSASAPLPSGTARSSDVFYYGSTKITNGGLILACILNHIDILANKIPELEALYKADKSYVDMKAWGTLCVATINAGCKDRAGLRIPKPSDDDFKTAAQIVASPVQGRIPKCDSMHISALIAQCPAIMSTVSWLRLSIIQCKGLLSFQRELKLTSLVHPYFDPEGSPLLDPEFESMVSATVTDDETELYVQIPKLKLNKKKEYITSVLIKGMSPENALKLVID